MRAVRIVILVSLVAAAAPVSHHVFGQQPDNLFVHVLMVAVILEIGLYIAGAYSVCALLIAFFRWPANPSRKLIVDVVLVIPFFAAATYVGVVSTVTSAGTPASGAAVQVEKQTSE